MMQGTTIVLIVGAVAFYVLTSLTYVLIPLASVYVLGEQVRRLHSVGTVLIIIGVVCVLAGD